MNKDMYLEKINRNMKLSKNDFLLIYCYEISYKGYADLAISKLEKCGCSRARNYYNKYVSEWEKQHEIGLKRAAEWYGKKIHEETETQEKDLWKRKKQLLDMKKQLLLMKNSTT